MHCSTLPVTPPLPPPALLVVSGKHADMRGVSSESTGLSRCEEGSIICEEVVTRRPPLTPSYLIRATQLCAVWKGRLFGVVGSSSGDAGTAKENRSPLWTPGFRR